MATSWKLNGFDLYAIYTFPSPPGTRAVKNRVKVENDIPDFLTAFQKQQELRVFFENLAQNLGDVGSPFEGWAPFAWGTELIPDWEKISS